MNTQTRPLEGKTALVTGGARGLGKALCDALCGAGARVVVVDVRSDLAEQATRQLVECGHQAMHCVVDVGDDIQVADCIAAARERFGAIDILINNAGVDYTLPIGELEVAQWDHVMATNLRGPFLFTKRVVAQMRPGAGGHIVNIASTAAKRAWPNASAYHASKWALLGFSHALHAELRPQGIKVTAVIAGGMRTPFLLDRFPDIDPGVLQPPEAVAEAVLQVLTLPAGSVIGEISVLPMGETSWP
ncbi:SDR family NAD(P)-dependent oxidoreductase [Azoarcus indigens]|uniref:NADP-dependent 3-hydroxy acid dehydrogenase YdfG n=1 Tax=Azoarcus indigens TaxID=29545 RepID=A0A4R6DUY2_9RHOO|nr:SDR family oxidoreductase [Azoarcus indigens]NMG68081.1 SDR family NAD(P)-dependent oxidoreductase [Azoarcus indigens]TDN48429.1 NADP-dependent 3-hydroxy acid dehydrogenase YdfG [Azoarcus indigens]